MINSPPIEGIGIPYKEQTIQDTQWGVQSTFALPQNKLPLI